MRYITLRTMRPLDETLSQLRRVLAEEEFDVVMELNAAQSLAERTGESAAPCVLIGVVNWWRAAALLERDALSLVLLITIQLVGSETVVTAASPDDVPVGVELREKLARALDLLRRGWIPMPRDELFAHILERVGDAESFLDVGCGGGEWAAFLAERTGKPVTGVDISERKFAHAHHEAAEHHALDLVQCLRADAHKAAQFIPCCYGAATMVYTLHHLSDPVTALNEIRKALKPGGKLLIVDWVIGEDEQPSGCHRLRVGEIQAWLETAGFAHCVCEMLQSDLVLATATAPVL